jgi:thiol-disulfide isomerase/thioredoxin
MTRNVFVALAAAAVTAPGAPKPTATPLPWDQCVQNPVLPYDRPLGLHMRVLDGPDFDLVKYRGYAVILNIFATWCEPCNDEMPSLVANSAKFYDRGLRVIGINYAESDDTVRAYRKKYAIPFPLAMDEHGGFAFNLEHGAKGTETAFPVLLFITPDGYLYCYTEGSSKHPEDELAYRIQKFLDAVPPGPQLIRPTLKPKSF